MGAGMAQISGMTHLLGKNRAHRQNRPSTPDHGFNWLEPEVSLTGPLVLVLGPGSIAPRLVSRFCARPRVSSQFVNTRPPEGVRSVQA